MMSQDSRQASETDAYSILTERMVEAGARKLRSFINMDEDEPVFCPEDIVMAVFRAMIDACDRTEGRQDPHMRF